MLDGENPERAGAWRYYKTVVHPPAQDDDGDYFYGALPAPS